jgi:hypothetical protein
MDDFTLTHPPWVKKDTVSGAVLHRQRNKRSLSLAQKRSLVAISPISRSSSSLLLLLQKQQHILNFLPFLKKSYYFFFGRFFCKELL